MSVVILSALGIWCLASVLMLTVWRRRRGQTSEAVSFAFEQAIILVPRIAVAMLAASFIAVIVPTALIAAWVGHGSGFVGLLISSLAGAIVPGGPVIAIPLAVLLRSAGAGIPQIIAFITAWSIFAMHRIIIYELTNVGWRFTVLRLSVCLPAPLLAGMAAYGLVR